MSAANPVPSTEMDDASHWKAELELEFEVHEGRTILLRKRHLGPLVTQQPHYPDGPKRCEAILVHPPAGIAGGDQLQLRVRVHDGAQAVLTTPGANRFYRARGAAAQVLQFFRVDTTGALEWLPQETLLYDRAHARCRTRIDLEPGAKLLTWEITGLGKPASNQPFRRGDCQIRLEVWRDGEPLWYDRTRYAGGGELMSAGWGLREQPCVGTWLATGATEEALEAARTHLAATRTSVFAAATRIDDLLVVRALGNQTRQIFLCFASLRDALRERLLGSPASPARIWST